MRLDQYAEMNTFVRGITGLFSVRGDFGVIDGENEYSFETSGRKTVYRYEKYGVKLCSEFTQFENGAIHRKDFLENGTGKEIELYKLSSRFLMDGNSYEVYTQYSSWQHESSGGWQKLVTQITAETLGIRTCDGATPMLGLHNLYNGKKTVFHLIPNCQWKMNVRKVPLSDKEFVVVETGLQDSGLRLTVAPNERIELPEVIFYKAESKTDLDAYKLHEAFLELYPRRRLPIQYNSWMYCFDMVNIDDLIRQASCAAEMGFEAFMVDAGWFGKTDNWTLSVGDWEENVTYGPKGRLIELSECVRKNGMVFGLWFEPERAAKQSDARNAHPEYFIEDKLLDFSNPKARAFVLENVAKAVDKYGVGWVKFDYNETIPHDLSGAAFYRYWQGYREFIKEFKARYPDVYLTNCGGGGFRMELGQATLFDSVWFSDNESPVAGVKIIKDTLKRIPSSYIERWNVLRYCEGFLKYANPVPIMKAVSCNDAIWDTLVGVKDSYVEEFSKGGVMGFSCDLASFPEKYKKRWKELIGQYKQEREFYKSAGARILVDAEDTTVIEYADKAFSKCVVQIFAEAVHFSGLSVYPTVDETAEYVCSLNGQILSGKEIMENGIKISTGNYEGSSIVLTKK